MFEDKRLEIVCPCCQATLIVDGSTGLILRTNEKRPDYSLEDALKQEKEKKDKADEKFAQAFKDEERRQSSLEEKFQKAMDSKDELEEPTRPWDFD